MTISVGKTFQFLMVAAFAVLQTWSLHAQDTAVGSTFEVPQIGAKGYHVGDYGDGAYWVTDGLYNSLFVVSNEGVIVIDAPWSLADKLQDAIGEVTDQPVKYFVYSHHHNDHTFGSGMFGDDVVRIGHELTAEELRRKNDPNRPVPTVTFEDTYTLTLGDQTVELSYHGLNHAPGNTYIFLPKQKVLMLVDVLYPGWVPYRDFAVAASTAGFYGAFDQAAKFDFKFFQGGHVARPGDRRDFEIAHEYVLDVQKAAGVALGMVQYPLTENPTNENYVPFNTYTEAVIETCTQIVTEKWQGRLNAVSIFTESHCWRAVIDGLID
jgi:glyoxylase-like metal-dependent hydrolase (beta-lactamase superfamily II)